MRTHRLLGILGLFLAVGLGLSVTLHLQAQGPALRVAPESEKMLEAFAEATKAGAPASALTTWATTHNATVSTLATGKTTVKAAVALVSGDTTAQDPPTAVAQHQVNCKEKCPAVAFGYHITKTGVKIPVSCSTLTGCTYDPALKKVVCKYALCGIDRPPLTQQ